MIWEVEMYVNKNTKRSCTFALEMRLDRTCRPLVTPKVSPIKTGERKMLEDLALSLEDSIYFVLRPNSGSPNEFQVGPLQLQTVIPGVTIEKLKPSLVPDIIAAILERALFEISTRFDLLKL